MRSLIKIIYLKNPQIYVFHISTCLFNFIFCSDLFKAHLNSRILGAIDAAARYAMLFHNFQYVVMFVEWPILKK